MNECVMCSLLSRQLCCVKMLPVGYGRNTINNNDCLIVKCNKKIYNFFSESQILDVQYFRVVPIDRNRVYKTRS